MRVLLAQPDRNVAQRIMLAMGSAAIVVDHTADAIDAIELAGRYDYDVILMDAVLPGCRGSDVVRRMRAIRIETPIIMLSKEVLLGAKIDAFSVGADDYLIQPFEDAELVARTKAVMRRNRGFDRPVLRVGRLEIDSEDRTAKVDGITIPLTRKELAVLELLVLRKGIVQTKEAFLDHIYGGLDVPEIKIVGVFICNIRRKLAQHGAETMIATVRERGYVLRAPRSEGYPALQAPRPNFPSIPAGVSRYDTVAHGNSLRLLG